MKLYDEMVTAIRAAQARTGPLVDPKEGQKWQSSLQRALGITVADATDYPGGRAYVLDVTFFTPDDEIWATGLRVRISAAGPYVTHYFGRRPVQQQWWSGTVQVRRDGFSPEDAETLERLRQWYRQNGLKEVPLEVQAQLLPKNIPFPRGREPEITLYRALFDA